MHHHITMQSFITFWFLLLGAPVSTAFFAGPLSSSATTSYSCLYSSLFKTTESNDKCNMSSRRNLILITSGIVVATFPGAAAHGKTGSNIKPDDAFANLIKGRQELIDGGKQYLTKRDYEGFRRFLQEEAPNLNRYEENAQAARCGI
mmetsp:Transcript_25042/g.37002  ORF Transcript_25042/g.37002 Transcript_25042/m.37002 type:complete len:147 (-) Transcript_25042:204-644(-)